MNKSCETRARAVRDRACAALFVSALLGGSAQAATCLWNSASGDWLVPGNWIGCADSPGPSTRSPGPTDTAVVANGTCNLGSSPTVAELELGSNGRIHTPGATRALTITQALRLNGGLTTTVLGSTQLHLVLAAGASGNLLASTSLDDATFLMNSGSLALGSATGASLNLKGYAQLQNLAGGHVTMAGGNSRLYLELGAEVFNAPGATFTIVGNAQIGKPAPADSMVLLRNAGSMIVNGPGTLDIPGGGINRPVQFRQSGQLTISNASVACNMVAGTCLLSDIDETATSTARTHLASAMLDLGGPGARFPLTSGARVSGNGTINGGIRFVHGVVAPGAPSGTPYATLAFTGDVQLGNGTLDFDIGGGAAGSHDALQVGGAFEAGDSATPEGRGRITLRLGAGYAPALGAAVPVMTYASVLDGAGFNVVDADHALDFATRFDAGALNVFPAPRLVIEDASLVEGSSGSTQMLFNLRLSQASAVPVTVSQLREGLGSATGNGVDFSAGVQSFSFAPGETLKQAVVTIHGDTLVEGDESFPLMLGRNGKLGNAAYGNGVLGQRYGVGTILSDELPVGTRMLLVGTDNPAHHIRRYTTGGLFIDDWNTGGVPYSGHGYTDFCFAPNGNILAARFYMSTGPALLSPHGAQLAVPFGDGVVFNAHETCDFDRYGNVYVGQSGETPGQPDTAIPLLKFNSSGMLLDSFVIPTGAFGVESIDLAADQCTLYYTSQDTTVRRYNVCTRAPMPILNSALSGPLCHTLHLRPNRELMVACDQAVHRLAPSGAILQTYTRESIGGSSAFLLYALALDPDGTSFWTGGPPINTVYRVDIASGAVLSSITGINGTIGGLAVYGEPNDDVLFSDGFDP